MEELKIKLEQLGYEYNLTSLLQKFPTTITLSKQDDGKYGAYCPAFSVGTLLGENTPEEAVGKLIIKTIDFYKNTDKKSKIRGKN